MTLFSNVRYTSSLYGRAGTPLPTAGFVHPSFIVYGSDAASYKQFAGIGFTPLYATLTRLEPSFNTTARSLHRGAAIF